MIGRAVFAGMVIVLLGTIPRNILWQPVDGSFWITAAAVVILVAVTIAAYDRLAQVARAAVARRPRLV